MYEPEILGKIPEICRINVEEKLSLRGWIFRIQTPSHIPLNSYLQISPGLLLFSLYLASHLITSICKTNKMNDVFVLLIDNPAALLLHALDFTNRRMLQIKKRKHISVQSVGVFALVLRKSFVEITFILLYLAIPRRIETMKENRFIYFNCSGSCFASFLLCYFQTESNN